MTFYDIINDSNNIVFFGGAGVSTESGIPDFRSEDGLYNQKYEYPPEIMLSHTFWERHPDKFYDFYRDKLIHHVKPNVSHYALTELEKTGKLRAIITQNIDGLHQSSGSKNVLELHGSILRNYCTRCNKFYPLEKIENSRGIPYCECGGIIKPDVVLYEESLNQDIINKSVEAIRNCDVLIVGGTSLTVYPAAGLIDYYRKDKLILINKSKTSYDERAFLVINESLGEVFKKI